MADRWEVCVKRIAKALSIALIALLFANCCCGASSVTGSGRDSEFYTEFSYSAAVGLGYQEGVTRRDPSDVIKVGASYYVWYTKTSRGYSGYDATIWYASSPDGRRWTEEAEAIKRGQAGSWDAQSVFTPNILVAEGRYYLFYTAISKPKDDRFRTAIGAAVSDSPDGPWKRFEGNPVLRTSRGRWVGDSGTKAGPDAAWDSHVVDDACLIVRDGKYWLYYKGRQMGLSPAQTKMGLAIADSPTGPYIKHKANPLIKSGHEVLVWPYRQGVVALIGPTGPRGNTIRYAPDGLDFSVKSRIKNPPKAPGAYRPDAFDNTTNGQGITWGISMGTKNRRPYLVRFDCALGVKKLTATGPDKER